MAILDIGDIESTVGASGVPVFKEKIARNRGSKGRSRLSGNILPFRIGEGSEASRCIGSYME